MTALKWERKEMSKSRILYLVKSVFKKWNRDILRLSKIWKNFSWTDVFYNKCWR